jgi:hypothetical protein
MVSAGAGAGAGAGSGAGVIVAVVSVVVVSSVFDEQEANMPVVMTANIPSTMRLRSLMAITS